MNPINFATYSALHTYRAVGASIPITSHSERPGAGLKCYSCPDASNDMQYDLVRSPFDLDLRSKNEVDLSRSPYL